MKKIILSLALFFTIGTSFSQSFMHGAGVAIFVGTTSHANGEIAVSEGLTYSPRFNFMETEALSVSVGVPLTLGISISYSYDSYYGETNSSLGYLLSAPLIVNLNMGRGSTKENTKKFGYFVGAGYGFHHGDFYGFYTDEYGYEYLATRAVSVHGPAANAGVRIGVGRKHKNIEIKLSYMKGINETKPNIFGLACLFNF
jgi:hypothetical protein